MKIIGVLLMLAGVVLGLYVGLYLCFVGGIIDVITEIRADDLSAAGVAWGVVKVLFAGVAGWGSFAVLYLPGHVMLQD